MNNPLHLDLLQWFVSGICAFLIGLSKTSFNGVSTPVIPVMAELFGGKASSGILLPLLIFGDLIAVNNYSRHAEWPYILRLLPWASGGIIIGVIVGNSVNDSQFKMIIAIIVLTGLGIMIWQERLGNGAPVPRQWWFSAVLGLAGGFSTMIGNAAGPVMGIYLLAMQLPKYAFIGTGAWFFMIINLTKVPFQVIFWKGITGETLLYDLLMAPAVISGAFIGIRIIRIIPEKPFRYIV
ncbi:MAG: sulfite exporter TauE/SafE family protein, partial [Brevinematales bacterium]